MDKLEVIYELSGESKGCIIYEPEEGADTVGKLYVRKAALGISGANQAPSRVLVTIDITDQED